MGKVDGPFDTESWKEIEIVRAYYATLAELEEAIRATYEKNLLASPGVDRMLMHDPDRPAQAQEEAEPPEWLKIYWEVQAYGGTIWPGGWWNQPYIATKIFNMCSNIEREIQRAVETMNLARHGEKP